MFVPLDETGARIVLSASGREEINYWRSIEDVVTFFGYGKRGWQDREQKLRYLEYTQVESQKEEKLTSVVRFVYDDRDGGLVWVIAKSDLR